MHRDDLKNKVLWALLAALFLPTLIELLVYANGEMDILPFAKLIVHFIVPILFVSLLMGKTIKQTILEPFDFYEYSLLRIVKLGAFVGFMAMTAIFGGHVIFSQLIDSTGIVHNLSSYGIDKSLFPIVALWIIFINPLMEEFFWRGFIFHRGTELAKTKFTKDVVLYGSGMVFALHHTVIIQEWFNWWQFLCTTVFLSCAGIIFNLMYKRTGSIIPTLIAHFMADLAIVVVGFQLFGFFV